MYIQMPQVLNQNSITKFTPKKMSSAELDVVREHFMQRLGEQVQEAEFRAKYSGRSTIMGRDVKVDEELTKEKKRLSGAGCRRLVKEYASNMHISKDAYANIQNVIEAELLSWVESADKSDEDRIEALKTLAPSKVPEKKYDPIEISLKPIFRELTKKAGVELQTSKEAKSYLEEVTGSICALLISECQSDNKTIGVNVVELATNIWLAPDETADIIKYAKAAVKKYKTNKGTTRSRRANILIPVSSVENAIRKLSSDKNVSELAPVYMAAVLEKLLVKVLSVSTKTTVEAKKRTITSHHIKSAISNTPELKRLYQC
mgnify:CR=1 FL=1|tara:strand:- start:1696 stop:2646 length:951 start_codon:yes stop_codon:yes gene_type:complete